MLKQRRSNKISVDACSGNVVRAYVHLYTQYVYTLYT